MLLKLWQVHSIYYAAFSLTNATKSANPFSSSAAISAKAMQPAQMTPIGQLNHLGDNIGGLNLDKMDGPIDGVKVIDQVQDALAAKSRCRRCNANH